MKLTRFRWTNNEKVVVDQVSMALEEAAKNFPLCAEELQALMSVIPKGDVMLCDKVAEPDRTG